MNKLKVVKRYWATGMLLSVTPYVDGKEDGVAYVFAETGEISYIENWCGGKRHGFTSAFNRQGQLIDRTLYTHGRIVFIKHYNADGTLKEVINNNIDA